MIRRFALVAVTACLAALAPGQAAAAPQVPGGVTVVYVDAAGEYCPFNMRTVLVSGAELRATTAAGLDIYTGPVVATVTNIDTGVSRTYNVSGPTFFDPQSGELVLTGPALVGQPASRQVGDPFYVVTAGRVTFRQDNTIAGLHGTIAHDVCAELA
jgi:hypothetical protein